MADALLFDMYRLLIEDAGALRAARRETNNFFLTLSTAGLGGIGFLMGGEKLDPVTIAALCGAMCITSMVWWRSIGHYARLVSVKYKIIKKLEDQLPFHPTQEEWELFAKGKRNQGNSHAERAVPLLFMLGYAGFALVQLVKAGLNLAPLTSLVESLFRH
jgi:hypothetical protein